jgi:hypothetical protein
MWEGYQPTHTTPNLEDQDIIFLVTCHPLSGTGGPTRCLSSRQLSPSNIIPKAEEIWNVQERDRHCEARTGQRSNP